MGIFVPEQDIMRFCGAACNTAVLQCLCFLCRLDYLHLKSNHAKFQLNPIKNGWVMVRLEILQCCMEYCSAAGSKFCLQTSSFPCSGGRILNLSNERTITNGQMDLKIRYQDSFSQHSNFFHFKLSESVSSSFCALFQLLIHQVIFYFTLGLQFQFDISN